MKATYEVKTMNRSHYFTTLRDTGKGFWVLLALLLIVLSAQPVLAASKQGNVYHWNYHTAYDKTYFNGGCHLQSWADRVWEETKHQLKINIFYNAGLGYK